MYRLFCYLVTPHLWRWELRCGDALLRCGTVRTWSAAQKVVQQLARA
jgi:hypothetical protein